MILIFTDEFEPATDYVIEWLNYYKATFLRLSPESKIAFVEFNSDDNCIKFSYKGETYTTKEFLSIWYRRGFFPFDTDTIDFLIKKKERKEIVNFAFFEIERAKEFFHYIFEEKPRLGSFFKKELNKLITLQVAKNIGIQIPETIITDSAKGLKNFDAQKKRTITKTIGSGLHYSTKNYVLQNFTEPINRNEIKKLTVKTLITLLQEGIEKKYELRIFFLGKKFYPMAIFSQDTVSSKYDSRRNINNIVPRMVPYRLPKIIQGLLRKLISTLKLDSGSIDMIVTPQLNYIFLEVNPLGQFNYLSVACNYNLEKKIAEHLINLKNEKK